MFSGEIDLEKSDVYHTVCICIFIGFVESIPPHRDLMLSSSNEFSYFGDIDI